MGKDSFILYTEQLEILEQLEDEQVGKIIKAIFYYQKDGIVPDLPKELKAIFFSFKIILDKNAKKWEEKRQKRSEAGKKGMAKRWKSQEVDNKNNNVINVITKDNKNNNVINDITKITDNVNVNVNVNDNVNVNNNNIKKQKLIKIKKEPTLNEIETYVKEKNLNVDAKQFYDYFSEGNWVDAKGNKVKSWKQKLLTWNSYAKPKVKQETEEEKMQRKLKELEEALKESG